MKLFMSMLCYQLQKIYKISEIRKHITDKHAISMPLLFDYSVGNPQYVYICNASDLTPEWIRFNDAAVICLGIPDIPKRYAKCEMICIEVEDSRAAIQTLFNDVSLIFQKYYDWINEMTRIAQSSQNLFELLSCSETILENPCILIDKEFNYLGYSSDFFTQYFTEENNSMSVPLKYGNMYRMDETFQNYARKKGVFFCSDYPEMGNLLCHNITYQGKYFARLIVHDKAHSFTSADEKHLSIFAGFVQDIFDGRPEPLILSNHLENVQTLIKSLAFDHNSLSGNDIDRILSETNWQRTAHYLAIYIRPMTSNRIEQSIPYLCSKIEQLWQGSCAQSVKNRILWVINLDIYKSNSDYAFNDNLGYFLRESLCQAGISNIFTDIGTIASYYLQAITALEIGGKYHPTHWYHYFRDQTFHYMLTQCTKEYSTEELCYGPLLKMIHYDSKNHTDYYLTLKTYILNQFSVTVTSKKLFIHRTTLTQRLKRITSLFSINLDDAQILGHIILSIALLERDNNL